MGVASFSSWGEFLAKPPVRGPWGKASVGVQGARKTSQNYIFTLYLAQYKHWIFANSAEYFYLNVKNMSCNAKYFDTYIKYS